MIPTISRRAIALALLLAAAAPTRARADAWSGSAHNLPPSRSFHTLVGDSLGNRAILFGGFRSEATPTGLGDLWSYELLQQDWRPLSASGTAPAPNWLHASVYDGRLRRMYVFGGQTTALYCLDLQTMAWSLVPTTGDAPPLISGHAMIYDWRFKRLVVFGGNFGSGLWVLDLASKVWTQVPPSGSWPAGRSFHTLTAERLASRAVLYGGFDGATTYFADTWELNLATLAWTQLILPGAPLEGRAYHLAAMDPLFNRLLVSGGKGLRASWKDTHSLNMGLIAPYGPTTWDSLLVQGDVPDPDEGSAEIALRGKFFQFAGRSSLTAGEYNASWSFDPTTSVWTALDTVPLDRMDAVALMDPVSHIFHLFGGVHATQRLADTWSYDGNKDFWTLQSPPVAPSARAAASGAVDSVGRQGILFGGATSTSLLKDTWSFSLDSLQWTPVATSVSPPRRQYACMASDPVTRRIWMFGGRGQSGPLGDLWYFAPDSGTWTQVDHPGGPGPRYLASMSYDPVRRKLMVFGGNNDVLLNGELWSFQLDSLVWRPEPYATISPSPREGHTAITDNQNQMVIFGGSTTKFGAPVSEVWAFDPSMESWVYLANLPVEPAPRWRHVAAWNPMSPSMRVFGGLMATGPANDLWLLELTAGAVGVPSEGVAPTSALAAPRPNPSRGTARLDFRLPAGLRGALAVYDAQGRKVRVLWSGRSDGLPQSATWDGRDARGARRPSGVYFIRLESEGGPHQVRKLVLLH